MPLQRETDAVDDGPERRQSTDDTAQTTIGGILHMSTAMEGLWDGLQPPTAAAQMVSVQSPLQLLPFALRNYVVRDKRSPKAGTCDKIARRVPSTRRHSVSSAGEAIISRLLRRRLSQTTLPHSPCCVCPNPLAALDHHPPPPPGPLWRLARFTLALQPWRRWRSLAPPSIPCGRGLQRWPVRTEALPQAARGRGQSRAKRTSPCPVSSTRHPWLAASGCLCG